MGKLWKGRFQSAFAPDASWANGKMWFAGNTNGDPDGIYKYDASDGYGKVWNEAYPHPFAEPDATYKNGRIWLNGYCAGMWQGSYDSGTIWTNPYREGSEVAQYEGSVGGAIAAAVQLLDFPVCDGSEETDSCSQGFYGRMGSKVSADSSEAESGSNEAKKTDNNTGGAVSSASFSSSLQEFVGFIMLLFVIPLGLIPLLVILFSPTDSSRSSRPAQSTRWAHKMPQMFSLPASSRWDSAADMSIAHVDSAGLSVITLENGEWLAYNSTTTGVLLLYEDTSYPHGARVSMLSPDGRYQMVAVCGMDFCDDIRLADFTRKRLAKLQILELDTSAKRNSSMEEVYWNMRSGYAMFSLGERLFSVNLQSLEVYELPYPIVHYLKSECIRQMGEVGNGLTPEQLMFDYNLEAVDGSNWLQPRVSAAVSESESASSGRLLGTAKLDLLIILQEGKVAEFVLANPADNPMQELSEGRNVHLEDAHKVLVEKLVTAYPGWRVLREDDCNCPRVVQSLSYFFDNSHPYYSVGDLDGDKKPEVAVVLYHEGESSSAVAVLDGGGHGGSSYYDFIELPQDLDPFVLFYDAPRDRLYIGPHIGGFGMYLRRQETGGFALSPSYQPVCNQRSEGLPGCPDR